LYRRDSKDFTFIHKRDGVSGITDPDKCLSGLDGLAGVWVKFCSTSVKKGHWLWV